MTDEQPRPAPLGGLWALIGGGILLAVTVVLLHPVTDSRDCPNHGGNGNASAFADDSWDFRLPVMAALWLLLILVEQTLPTSWRHRTRSEVATRAGGALLAAGALACCGLVPLETLCR